MKRLFLDDYRIPLDCASYMYKRLAAGNLEYLEDWEIVRNYAQFTRWIEKNGLPDLVSFDHDLADQHYDPTTWTESFTYKEKTGADCAQFVVDYDVRPLAVEIALVHPYSKYAGMIDLPCTMLAALRSKNRIRAIVDFKSGKKGFFEEAEIQLHFYKDMWNVNYPHLQIDRVFNFAPKDWRKRPTYNLKDQTNSPNSKKIPALLELASIEDGKKDNVFVSVSGKINLDNGLNFDENIISLSLSEIIKKKAPKPKETTPAKPAKKETLKVEKPKEVLKQEPKQTKIIKRKSVTVKKTTPVEKTTKKQPRVPVVKKQAVKTIKKEVVNKSDLLDNEISI